MEWIMVVGLIWGDGYIGGESQYQAGSFRTLRECLVAAASHEPTRLGKIVQVTCQVRDQGRAS
jgi:hypothetical protein